LPNEVGRSLPKLLRDRAEECRTLARIVTDQQERDGYLTMAQAYEALAAQEEATRNELERRTLEYEQVAARQEEKWPKQDG
jgi:hypothetical protein